MKRNVLILMTLCLLAVVVFPVHAAAPYLTDEAGLLSNADAAALETKLAQISGSTGVDIVIVTVDSTGGKSPMEFADDLFDYGGYGADGILLLISMEDSDWWVSTTGYGITAVTDAGLSYMADRFVPYFSDGAFADGFDTFADLCEAFLAQAKTGDPYDIHNLPKEPFSVSANLLFALAVGAIAGWIATAVMKGRLKSVRQQERADAYIADGSLQLTHSRDLFLYTHLDRRERPKSSSGGSTTHVSSSGRSHGGGGGKF